MKKRKRRVSFLSPSEIEDRWQQRAVAAAISAARAAVGVGGVSPGIPIGRLGDVEWGWIGAGFLSGWICTRAEQAVSESIDTEQAVRLTGLDPEPWDAGAITSILSELAETPDIDWAEPLAKWPRETMIDFLLKALSLVRKAMLARDLNDSGVMRRSDASTIARQTNTAAGDLSMAPGKFEP